jgi:hypothetical protein
MLRKTLMVLLAAGAVAGFGAGFARLHAGGGHFGHGRHAELERRVADACTESALRVYGQKAGAAQKP